MIAMSSRRASFRSHANQRGFTLIEAIIVLVLTGIVAGMVGVFIARPIDAYVDLARRAELSDSADMALRRVAREIAKALPNSVRVGGGGGSGDYLEFLPVAASGRYLAAPAADGSGDFFNVDDPTDNSFQVLGPNVLVPAASGLGSAPYLAVYNLGIPGADAYTGESIRALTSFGTLGALTYDLANGQFTYPSPGNRFQVITTPISYACLPAAGGAGTLRRYTGYGIQSTQPISTSDPALAALTGTDNVLLADHVLGCSFSYTAGASARIGIVTMRLTLSSGGEQLTLVHQAHVDNSP